MKKIIAALITFATILGICGSSHAMLNNAKTKNIPSTAKDTNGTEGRA